MARAIADGDIAARGNFTVGVWTRILLMANWKDSSDYVSGQQAKLLRGQLCTGLRELSPCVEEDPHLHRVRSALQYLEKTGRIAQATSNHGRIITVLNYNEFQEADEQERKQPAGEPQAERKQTASKPQANRNIYKKEEGRREEGKNNTRGERAAEPHAQDALIPDLVDKQPAPTQVFISAYIAAFQRRYPGGRPDLTGKAQGQIKTFLRDTPIERACELIRQYCAMTDRWFLTKGHDFETFRQNVTKVGLALDTGRTVTATEAAQMDRTQANFNAFAPLIAAAEEEERRNGKL